MGPLRVQRSFYPEGPVCHTYLLHPPGGVVGGDGLTLSCQLEPGSHALITTPAAAKFYRSAGARAVQQQSFLIAANATLEWLPSLNIIQGGARVELINRYQIASESRLLAWEATGLGRPGSGDHFTQGTLTTRLELDLDGAPLLRERFMLAGSSADLAGPWGMHGHTYLANLLAWPASPALLEQLRAELLPINGVIQAGTLLREPEATASTSRGLLVWRCLATTGEPLSQALLTIWQWLRPRLLDRAPCPPRIWST